MDERNAKHFVLPAERLARLVREAAARTRDLHEDLGDEQLEVPRLEIVNPLLWEVGHVAFFHEAFLLRRLGFDRVLMPGGEELYDSFDVDHDERWDLPLPSREETYAYAARVEELAAERLESAAPDPRSTYLALLAVQHEDMHAEAFATMRQALGYPAPRRAPGPEPPLGAPDPAARGDVEIPGGRFRLGARPEDPFVYDNEKWGHELELGPFRIARTPVTEHEFLAFVEDGGYARRELWSRQGWSWRARLGREHPVYWRRESGGEWLRRDFDREVPLEANRPAVSISWHEACAWCEWAGRRLPAEAEWERAAAGPETAADGLPAVRRVPWSSSETSAYDEPTASEPANLGGVLGGCVDVDRLAGGDSPSGCRQTIGNVWEWTASPFYPFEGYVVDRPYREYSAPWFGYRKVLKGGSWATPRRLAYTGFRNFFPPDRCDVFAGFRTCAR